MELKGNPQIVLRKGDYKVVERGINRKYYTILKDGETIKGATWKGRGLYTSALMKSEYKKVNPPQKYIEE